MNAFTGFHGKDVDTFVVTYFSLVNDGRWYKHYITASPTGYIPADVTTINRIFEGPYAVLRRNSLYSDKKW
jgi:hypothetical protein